jgi:hypothetical protein
MISLQPSETIAQKSSPNLTKMETKSKTWKKTTLVWWPMPFIF